MPRDSLFPADVSDRIHHCGVAAVLVVDDAEFAVPLARALLAGDLDVMELTLRTPAAIEALRRIRDEVPEMVAGIGTVLTPAQVHEASDAGAAFAVAPGMNPNVVREAGEVGLPFAPGIVTASDLEAALELGCRDMKFFPAEPSGGIAYLKSLAAPYAHLDVRYIPLGGLSEANMRTYLAESVVLAIGGSWIAPRDLIQQQDWQEITNRAMRLDKSSKKLVEVPTHEGRDFWRNHGPFGRAGFLRFRQALPGSLDVTFAGAEANVAVSLSLLGAEAVFVSALPDNVLTEACIATLEGLGVDTRHIVNSDAGRLGLYFLECGANQRPSQVIYDREGSSISMTPSDRYDWETVFQNAKWFHVTGITPAISQVAAEATLAAVRAAKQAGVSVSCDLNFRKKLWRWDPSQNAKDLAGETMRRVLQHVDVVIANEEDCESVLGIQAADTDVEAGKLQIDRYPDVARKVAQQFPEISKVAITLRESISASHNNWGGMLYAASEDSVYFAPLDADGTYCPYPIRNIVDRVGGGDSFAAALIFALLTEELQEPSLAIRFAVAASCLAHSVVGDFNFATRTEVEALMRGSGAGRVIR